MPVSIKSSGGGSVTIAAVATASDTTLTLPSANGTVLTTGTAVTAAQGGTGLTSPGTAGNLLTSDGTNWTSAVPATPPAPAALSTASGSAPSYSARAWVNFNGTGTVAIRASGNVSSITDNGTGDYTVNFTTAMSDANYCISVDGVQYATGSSPLVYNIYGSTAGAGAKTASLIRVNVIATNSVLWDTAEVNVSIFR